MISNQLPIRTLLRSPIVAMPLKPIIRDPAIVILLAFDHPVLLIVAGGQPGAYGHRVQHALGIRNRAVAELSMPVAPALIHTCRVAGAQPAGAL